MVSPFVRQLPGLRGAELCRDLVVGRKVFDRDADGLYCGAWTMIGHLHEREKTPKTNCSR
jgi:hypothetical protein